MGYSIATTFQTEEQKENMKKFLIENYQSLKKLTRNKRFKDIDIKEVFSEYETYRYNKDQFPYALGFDYYAGFDEERDYFFMLCYWMSIMAGEKKTFGIHHQMPFALYDNETEFVLFVNQKGDRNLEWVEVNEDGYLELLTLSRMKSNKKSQKIFKEEIEELEVINLKIKHELNRLTTLWNEKMK